MITLTKQEALLGELEPYSPSSLTIKKALFDVGISDPDSSYVSDTDKRSIALAAIAVLKKMIVLSGDTMGKSTQNYNVDALKERIMAISNENGIDASQYIKVSSITDGSNMW